jgi:glycosyltransferase involved in cell wall biosynthesis
MKLTVVIPIFNEAGTIRTIVERVLATGLASEILLVDDHSSDGSRDKLANLNGQKGVQVILHEKNLGKGAAVRSGLAAASGEVILIQDADL